MNSKTVTFLIDGKSVQAPEGQRLIQAIRDKGFFIPSLCDFKDLPPAGTCRLCTVKVGGHFTSACTTLVSEGMNVENDTAEIKDLRLSLIEMLFVEGNHMCPSCEKSGDCELQALAYRYQMTAPRFPFSFPNRKIDATLPYLLLEHNRCIQCLRCVRGVKSSDQQELFGFTDRGSEISILIDASHPEASSKEVAQRAMDICPVGALIKKGEAYHTPIGERTYDHSPKK